jgi:hypothetical protein
VYACSNYRRASISDKKQANMSLHEKHIDYEKAEVRGGSTVSADDPDAEFGGPEARKALEKKLLLKIDLRMSILVVVYILNYVRCITRCHQLWSPKIFSPFS